MGSTYKLFERELFNPVGQRKRFQEQVSETMLSTHATTLNDRSHKPRLSFSIERILHGNFRTEEREVEGHRTLAHAPELNTSTTMQVKAAERYAWLAFTRYNPPKLPKSTKLRKKKKRKPGRNPRVPFTTKQLTTLEGKFQKMKYLSNEDVALLCKALELEEHRIKIWFQNRRAREKKKCQDEYIDVTGLDKQ